MYNLIEDDVSLEKHNTIWDKISSDIKKDLIAGPVYIENLLKTKIKSHDDEVTDFYDKNIPKLGSNHTSLAAVSLYSPLKKDDNYYLRVFLKQCKYIEKKLLSGNLSDFSSSNESDEQ